MTYSYRIPFNRPHLAGNEIKYIRDAIFRGHAAGNGVYTRRCQHLIERALGARKALLTTSCTHALEIAALLLDIAPGDEIILPSFTFVSTANAFVLRGGRPVFLDIRPDTLNADERKLEALITPNTKAIVIVHYAGVGCEIDEILKIAGRHGLPVIEDNAHGLLGRYKGRFLGTFGDLAALSFHETKNFTCGEGGALVVNNPRHAARAEVIRDKGTNRSRFMRGEINKYTWVDIGSSYLPSDLLSGFLYAQLEARSQIQSKRRKIWEYYHSHLEEWARANDVQLPFVPPHCEQSFHMYYMILPSEERRKAVIDRLRSQGILGVFHYQPLHLSKKGRPFMKDFTPCPVTERVSSRLLRLPFYTRLSLSDQRRVLRAILDS